MALIAAVLVAVGISLGVLIVRTAAPSALASPVPISFVGVKTRDYSDPRSVDLLVTAGQSAELISPRSGLLTGSRCVVGGAVVSGESTFDVDGRRVLNLSTTTPLWRDLALGATGDDVSALNAELARLGSPTSGSKVTSATVSAFSSLARRAGLPTMKSIQRSDVMWLPAARVSVQACTMGLGQQVAAGAGLVKLPRPLTAARLVSLPTDLAPGARVLVLGAARIPVDSEGKATPDGLAQLTSLPQVISVISSGQDPKVSGVLQLDAPLTVLAVPPAALGRTGAQSCVMTPQGKQGVTIVGSSMGQTFVTVADGKAVDHVSIASDWDRQCS